MRGEIGGGLDWETKGDVLVWSSYSEAIWRHLNGIFCDVRIKVKVVVMRFALPATAVNFSFKVQCQSCQSAWQTSELSVEMPSDQ